MKKLSLFFLIGLLITACTETSQDVNSETDTAKTTSPIESPFIVDTDEMAAVSHENLRLYAIQASEEHILRHTDLASYKNLKDGMNTKGFHVTEKKPYGRFDDDGAVNSLTIQNKSQDTIYLMAGDVVKGGKQDRIIAQDMVVPPRTITDIAVFCVEPNRWDYQGNPNEESEQQAAQDKKIFAFTGYYNVASNEIRKTVKQTKNQKAVWEKVGKFTAINNASSETGSYTALENSKEFTAKRNVYLNAFKDAFGKDSNTVGIIAVSGNEVLGADIFNHPTLFQKQYPSLLHAYITDAITKGKPVEINAAKVIRYADRIKRNYNKDLPGDKETESKFRYNGKIVHFTQM